MTTCRQCGVEVEDGRAWCSDTCRKRGASARHYRNRRQAHRLPPSAVKAKRDAKAQRLHQVGVHAQPGENGPALYDRTVDAAPIVTDSRGRRRLRL